MRVLLVVLAFGVALGTANPSTQRIVGGSQTSIRDYPELVSLLRSYWGFFYDHYCGGVILNKHSVLTAASCMDSSYYYRIRAGSSFYNSGGSVYTISSFARHANYIKSTLENNIAIVYTTYVISFNSVVQPAKIAGTDYILDDDQTVWTAGWGSTSFGGSYVEQVREVSVKTISTATCKSRYVGDTVTDNMLCSGFTDVGGYGQCNYDQGTPLYHNGVVVGIFSWSRLCGTRQYPAINTRISRYESWINANA